MNSSAECQNTTAPRINRRAFLERAALVGGALTLLPGRLLAQTNANAVAAPAKAPRYKIAVCDWMILKRQKLGAFALAKELGADGVEVDMGSLGERETFESQLNKPEVRQQFLDQARALGLEIPSLAMSGFYAQSFAERATVPRMVQDCLDTMVAMQVETAFLPLGVKSDLLQHPEVRPAVLERLKAAGAQAEKAGVVIGVESELDAAAQIKLLDEVGSPGIKIYYNLANAIQHGRNYVQELLQLGKARLCQIHCTNTDGFWLQNDPQVNLLNIKSALDAMGWSGWLVVERSRDAKDARNVKKNFSANVAYLKSIFQKS